MVHSPASVRNSTSPFLSAKPSHRPTENSGAASVPTVRDAASSHRRRQPDASNLTDVDFTRTEHSRPTRTGAHPAVKEDPTNAAIKKGPQTSAAAQVRCPNHLFDEQQFRTYAGAANCGFDL